MSAPFRVTTVSPSIGMWTVRSVGVSQLRSGDIDASQTGATGVARRGGVADVAGAQRGGDPPRERKGRPSSAMIIGVVVGPDGFEPSTDRL